MCCSGSRSTVFRQTTPLSRASLTPPSSPRVSYLMRKFSPCAPRPHAIERETALQADGETRPRLRYSSGYAGSLRRSFPRTTPGPGFTAPRQRAGPRRSRLVHAQQARITEIPAPPFQEAQRAAAVKELLAETGLPAHIDKTGDVIGELRGLNEKEIVVIAAHLDTVFPPGTDVKVHRDGNRMAAPGISDNGSGVAALLALARAVQFAHLKPQRTILFVGDVGEEGEGNLRGMRAIVDTYRGKLKAIVVLDGSGTDHVTTKALASRRLEALITGPG